MANAVADRLWRPSAPDRIEADLAALWREIAREGLVSRAVMSNLVVYCRCPADRDIDLAAPPAGIPVEGVARHHPARVILLHHDPEAPDAQLRLEAHVGVLIFGPAGARYGVEQIVLRSTCSEAALPSIVRPLMLGDVPTAVWWTEDFTGTRPLTPLVTMGRQLVYDSRRWRDVPLAVAALMPLVTDRFGPDLADVNWRRLTPVREALIHAIGSGGTAKRPTWSAVRIRHRAGEAALAWLLAGWLERAWGPPSGGPIRLKPDPTDVGRVLSDPPITVDEDPLLHDDLLIASFGDDLELRLGAHHVTTDDPLGPAPFTMPVPHEEVAQAIAAELRVLTHDRPFHDTLGALARRFGAA
jgi:hypothetical protein